MKYKVNVLKLHETGEYIEKYAIENLENKYQELIGIFNDIEWKGSARDAYFADFEKRLNKIVEINEYVKKLGKYMQICSEHYGESNENIMKAWNGYLDELEKDKMLEARDRSL